MTATSDRVLDAPGARGVGLGPYVSALHARWLDAPSPRRWDHVAGTLVFADVSGFTPLAERLARRGKVGAEELTDTLNLVFVELLEVAARFGGDCLKFGGDALLLHFTGSGHERRGVAAAHAMGAALRRLRRQPTSAGLAKLGISMGVHSGALEAFLVGSSHRELVLAGPAVSAVLALESAAPAGQILVSETTAAALDLEDVEALDDGSLRLRRAPAAPVLLDLEPWVAERPWAGIPVALREHLDGQAQEGEHRVASIGFLKFSGSDHLLAGDGAPALADALDELITLVQQQGDDLGVSFLATDVDRDGGKVILATGMPTASADDEDRLLLALRGVLSESAGPLRLRAGANRGRIFSVDLGSPERRTFTVMGDAVNLAARVMGKADPGELVATDALLERRRTTFDLDALDPFTVKGKSAPVSASRVGAPLGRRDEGLLDTALVGRTSEVAVIRRVFETALFGQGGVVELVGEPGIGKSKLTRTVTELDHGLEHLAFEAGRYSLATPYFALRRGMRAAMGLALDAAPAEVERALEALVATVAPELARWLPLIALPLGVELPDTPDTADLDPSHRRAALHAAVGDLLTRTLSTPTLITIEDAHWLDGASCELIAALLADVERRPWAVLVTRRPVPGGLELDEGIAVRRHLEPLGHDELVALARAVAGDAVLPPGAIEELVERSGGNPLFLQEMVSAAVAGRLADLPDSIEAVVAASIDTLATTDRTLLRHAAVLGGHLPIADLVEMVDAPGPEVARDLDRLSHFLVPAGAGAVRFRHILLRDVAYEGLSYRARRALHERAGEIIEARAPDPEDASELLSIHFHSAGRFPEAWRYARLAGDRAQRAGAPREAAGFYRQALDAGRRVARVAAEDLGDVAEALGDALELSGQYEPSFAAYQQARRMPPSAPLRAARLCRKIGHLRDREGRYSAAIGWYSRGLREVEDREERAALGLRAELTTAAVCCRIGQGKHAGAVTDIEAAIHDARAGRSRKAHARALVVFDQLLVDQGRYAEAHHSDEAVVIFEELGDHRGAAGALNEMGSTAYWLGRWDEAVGHWERAIEADRRSGALVNQGLYLNNIGEVRSDQGRWQEAESLLIAARDLFLSGGWRICEGWTVSNLGRLATRDGRLAEAEALLAEAREILTEIGADVYVLETDVREMERRVFAADAAGALGHVDELRARATRLGMAGVLDLIDRLEGCARCLAGELDEGQALLRSSVTHSRDKGAEYEVAAGLEAVAWAARIRGEESPGRAVEATALYRALGVVRSPELPMPRP